ncbi:MAG: aminoglycoside phosphotransferase family protein [Devosia sp.]
MEDDIPAAYRAAIAARFPELAASGLTLLNAGWDSVAVDADDRLIFKFPRNESAALSLRREARFLAHLRPRLTLPVPALELCETPFLFSVHEKLRGEHLVTAQYAQVSEPARDRMAAKLAQFYAELHSQPLKVMQGLGATPIKPWLTPEDILARAAPHLEGPMRDFLKRSVAAWAALPPDPFGLTYGFFDGHGWNMAFDHASETLNGVYDFADSGIGALTQDFIYSDFISTDLTDRIVAHYRRLTARAIDLDRVRLLSGVLRLTELAQYADDPAIAGDRLAALAEWIGR